MHMKKEILLLWVTLVAIFCYFQMRSDAGLPKLETIEREEDFELAEPMGQMLQFMDKLYFAGKEENWELASFYLHEIEEQAESIVEADIQEGGVNLSHLVDGMLVPQVEALEQVVEGEGRIEFESAYRGLVDKCNACHEGTKHHFIRIKVPEKSMFTNQQFNK